MDRIRTALEGSGTINIKIEVTNANDVQLCVTESWARLTGVQRSEIKAQVLDAAADPDKFIADELACLFNKHINWRAAEPTYPDSTGEVTPREHQANWSSFGETGCDERGMGQFDKSPILSEKVVESIQAGTYISLQPARYKAGETRGVQVIVDGINPTFSAMRRLNQTITGPQLDASENPTALVWQKVYDMVSGLAGPI